MRPSGAVDGHDGPSSWLATRSEARGGLAVGLLGQDQLAGPRDPQPVLAAGVTNDDLTTTREQRRAVDGARALPRLGGGVGGALAHRRATSGEVIEPWTERDRRGAHKSVP